MNVVDSSAWLEYFGNGPNAGDFAAAIEAPQRLAAPTLTLFEASLPLHSHFTITVCTVCEAPMGGNATSSLSASRIALVDEREALHSAAPQGPGTTGSGIGGTAARRAP